MELGNFQKLIAEGAVDIVVPGVLPVGCFPVYLSLSVSMFKIKKEGFGSRSGCMKKFNTLAWVHNSLLRQTITQLRVKYPGARIIYADYYSAAIQFILHPEKFGQLIFFFNLLHYRMTYILKLSDNFRKLSLQLRN